MGGVWTTDRLVDVWTTDTDSDRLTFPIHTTTNETIRRSLPKVQGFVQVPSLFYAGSHGFDIWGPTLEDTMRYQARSPCRLATDCVVSAYGSIH